MCPEGRAQGVNQFRLNKKFVCAHSSFADSVGTYLWVYCCAERNPMCFLQHNNNKKLSSKQKIKKKTQFSLFSMHKVGDYSQKECPSSRVWPYYSQVDEVMRSLAGPTWL